MTDAGDAFEPSWADQLPTDETKLDDAAVAYAELGFSVLPVWGVRRRKDGVLVCLCGKAECKVGKHPIGDRWHKTASSDVDVVRSARAHRPNANIGLRMGGQGRLVAVDIDGPDGRASLEALEAVHGPLPVTLSSATGREDGGEHRLFRVPEGLDLSRIRTRTKAGSHVGIDTRAEGGQIVVAPSRHETGAVYRWTVRAPIADMPKWLYEALATPLATVTRLPPRAPSSRPSSSGAAASRAADFRWRYVEKALENASADIAACPPGQRNDKLFAKSCTVFEYFLGEGFDSAIAYQRLFDAGCACGMSPSEVRSTLAKSKDRAQRSPRRAPDMPERPDHAYQPDASEVPFEARAREHEAALEHEEDEDASWEDDLQADAKWRLKGSLANIVTILSRHPEWRGVVVWDDFAQTIVKRRLPPVREGDRSPKLALGEWTDGDSGRAVTWISRTFDLDVSARAVEEALLIVAERASCNPVREYLEGIAWDGVPRVDTFLTTHFKVPDSPYVRGVSSRWLISAVARAFQPGCDVDCILVFEGQRTRHHEGQGSGKSKGLRALVPDRAWFADTPLVIGDKDSYQNLRGKWIYEIGELAGLKGRDVDRTKNFLSGSVDNLRASYGRRNRDYVRALVFAASTNDHHYLADRTGNRRFWPVRVVGDVDREAIVRDRDQIWAEAVHRYRAGEAWHADTPEFRALAREEQEERVPDSPWRGPVERWLETPWVTVFDPADGMKKTARADISHGGDGVTTTDVLQSAIGMALDRIDRRHEIEMGSILREIGLEAVRLRRGDGRQRRYRWPAPEDKGGGPIGGGDWTEIGPENHLSNQAVTSVVQLVQSKSGSGASAEKKTERSSSAPRDHDFRLGQLDHSGFLGGVLDQQEPEPPSNREPTPTPEPLPAEPPRPTPTERASLEAILARVGGGRGSASKSSGEGSTHGLGARPRAPEDRTKSAGGAPQASPSQAHQGPARGHVIAGAEAPRRPVPRPDDDDEDLLSWLDRA